MCGPGSTPGAAGRRRESALRSYDVSSSLSVGGGVYAHKVERIEGGPPSTTDGG